MEQQPPIAPEAEAEQLSELLQIRRDKLAALQQAGHDPFRITTYERTHAHAQIRALERLVLRASASRGA